MSDALDELLAELELEVATLKKQIAADAQQTAEARRRASLADGQAEQLRLKMEREGEPSPEPRSEGG